MPQATAIPAMAPVERPLEDELVAAWVELELEEDVLLGFDVAGAIFPEDDGVWQLMPLVHSTIAGLVPLLSKKLVRSSPESSSVDLIAK